MDQVKTLVISGVVEAKEKTNQTKRVLETVEPQIKKLNILDETEIDELDEIMDRAEEWADELEY